MSNRVVSCLNIIEEGIKRAKGLKDQADLKLLNLNVKNSLKNFKIRKLNVN